MQMIKQNKSSDSHGYDVRLHQTLQAIGQKIHDLRVNKGFASHESFALEFDLPRVQYWRIEKGKSNVTMRSLGRILAIHGMTIEEFFQSLSKDSKKKKLGVS